MFPMENKSAGGEENVMEVQADADDSARGCAPADEVASAVAAVSDEIGDILKDELGDADKADRIELELADLSAELGILAGLSDGETQPGFPSLFEMAMVQNESHSSTSSVECTWTNRRRPRPHNAKRAITKGKESRRRRLGRRATRLPPMPDGVSDISDVGADCDSDEHQWTDTTASSESSSEKEAVADLESIFSKAEAPPMGQFLLPLLSTELGSSPPHRQHHRHSDMWQLMMGEEEMLVTDVPLVQDAPAGTSSEVDAESIIITPEDEVALLNFVCEGNDPVNSLEGPDPEPLPAWLQSLYRAWGELGALLYTLVGEGAGSWVNGHVLVAGTCSCSTCLARAHHRELCAALLQRVIARLYTDENTQREAAQLFKALKVTCRSDLLKPFVLDCRLVNALTMSPRGTAIVFEALTAMASRGELARAMVESVCVCEPCLLPMDMEHAVERFVKILKCYAASSIILFKVEMYLDGNDNSKPIACRYLSHAGASTRDRLQQIAARATPPAVTAWTDYQLECNCNSTKKLSNEERKKLFRQLFFRMMKGTKTSGGAKRASQDGDEQMDDVEDGSSGGDMLEPVILDDEYECYNVNELGELVVKPEWSYNEEDFNLDEDSDMNSLNLTSSSLSSSSAAEAGSVESARHGGELVRTVRHLMRSIASIERLMQRVLKLQDHCVARGQQGASSRVDLGLSEVDKKLMAMYKRLPDVHRKQLHVYKKQKKLSTACSLVVGGRAPSPPEPPAAPPASKDHDHALTYHLHRFHEVRRKVMHMKEQQLYYHRLRIWLEDQLKQNGDNANEPNIKIIEDIKRKRRTSPRRITKHKSSSNKPYKILELLKQKAPSNTAQLLEDLQDDAKSDVDPPDAFSIDKDDLSDTDTIVGEEMCKEMKECLAKFASFALTEKAGDSKEFPESISPPLHEISPTNTEPMPVYSPNPNQRLLTVNKLLKRQLNKDDRRLDFSKPSITDIFNVAPINARRTPMLVEQIDKGIDIKASEAIENQAIDVLVEQEKESINKYVSLGLEMKKAFDECENIINTYGGEEVKRKCKQTESLSLEQICTALLNMENDPNKVLVSDDDNDFNRNFVTKIIENLPQMIADLPKMATETLKMPEFVSIINDLPELTNEDQLSPETLKQIRELKLTKNREKVTKNTSKRKTLRRPKTNSDDITMTFEFDSEDLNELIAKGGKEFETLLQSQAAPKEEFKHVIFSMAGKYALEKLFGHLKDETNPDIIGFLHLHKVKINTFMLSKASSLFDDYVKDATSIKELMVLVRQRLSLWLNRVFIKYDHVEPVKESEIDEAIVKKFYEHVKESAEKQSTVENYSIDDIDELKYLNNDKDSLKQITKLLSTSAGSAFDLIIMKLSHMPKDKKSSVTSLKFKYLEVISRCSQSQQLASWIVLNPEIAASVIFEMTGLPPHNDNEKPPELRVDISSLTNDQKQAYFMQKLREMNKLYLRSLPRSALTSSDWLLLLYRLEQLEVKLNEALTKSHAPKPIAQNNVSETHEAEILAARGLSKIIGKSSKPIKKEVKSETVPLKNINLKPIEVKQECLNDNAKMEESKPKVVLEKFEKAQLNEALYAKYENVLKSNGHKELLELFYKIKSYLSKGQPVPESYTNQYIEMCSNIDMSLLNFELSTDLTNTDGQDIDLEVEAKNLSVIGSQNPELLAKYTAQALRNAKQTLNAVAFEVSFKNALRNGSKSESDVCDAPKSDCNWTNDCICNTCQESEVTGSCLGDIVKQCYDMEAKSKAALDDKKKEVKVKQPVKPAKPVQQPKPCDNVQHQQHVCKMGHSPSGSGSCASEGGPDQPCTCCYCTVFGHAPPVTTPVPRNFNETRERLRLILSKKKQKTGKPVLPAEPKGDEALVVNAITQMFEKTYGTQNAAQTNANPNPKVKLEQAAPPVRPQVQAKPQPSQTQPSPQQPTVQQPQQPVQQAKPQTQTPIQPKPAVQQVQPVQQASLQKPAVQPPSQPAVQQKQPAVQQKQPAVQQKQPAVQQKQPVQLQTQPKPPVKQQMPQPKSQEVQQTIQPPQQPPQTQVQQKVVNNTELEQKQLQERMAKMTVTDNKPKPLNIQPQAQAPEVVPLSTANAEAKINAQAMEQIRQQQLKQQQLLLQQQQLKQAQQQQQLQQQQQWLNQQQQQEQRRRMSISSCCSGSSHSSGSDAYWRGHEDPRDLDALLQYIEGPTRHVDRGKKRAKKQRQRAKKTESKMLEERQSLVALTQAASRRVAALVKEYNAAAQRHARAKETLQAHKPTPGKKGKKPKLNPTQQAKAQQIAEQLGELNVLMNNTHKELIEAQDVLADYTQQLEDCEAQIREARNLLQGSKGDKAAQQSARYNEEKILRTARQQHYDEVDRERQIMNNTVMAAQVNQANAAYHMINNGSASSMRAFKHLTVLNACEDQPQPKQESKEKKQTWEQALAHMNQLVTNANKEKQKKQKEQPKAEPKPSKEQTRSHSLPDDSQNLSKKQRKLLARQQAEEEEARLLKQQQQQEAKNKKSDSKKQQESSKTDKAGKKDKMAAAEQNGVAGKKVDAKVDKSKDKKGKENKVEKNAQTQPQQKQPKAQPVQKPTPQPQPLTKKERKKDTQQKQQPMVNNAGGYINSDVGKVPTQNFKPTPTTTTTNNNNNNNGCSIMSQLSSGVLVSELRLPPGITLTRVCDTHRQSDCKIHPVPVWKSSELPVQPTPVARPPPIIDAHPSMMMFSQSQINEPPKTIIMAEPPPAPQIQLTASKSKKNKKKSKKQTENQLPTTQFIESSKPDGTKMVTLRNPMFHSNLPPVHTAHNPVKKPEARPQDNMPLSANPCQATITPTSNGMYTIRNPLMSMMHQQTMMTQPPQMYQQPNNYNYVNPNVYNQPQPQAYVIDSSRQSPINQEKIDSNRLLNLASFTQKNEEGYSLFKKEDSNNQKGFLNTDYYTNTHVPNSNVNFPPTVSPNPIGTRPEVRHFEQVNDSLFTNNSIHRPEPIGTGLKKVEDDKNEFRGGLYTPFGQEDRNVFRNALFDSGVARNEDLIPNGEGLPYFQRLRAGAKLNNEVTIHHVTESKFYKNAEPLPPAPPQLEPAPEPYCYGRQCWSVPSSTTGFAGDAGVGGGEGAAGRGVSPLDADEGFGAVGTRALHNATQHDCQNMFHSARSLTDLSSTETLEAMQRYEQLYIQKQRMHQLNTN